MSMSMSIVDYIAHKRKASNVQNKNTQRLVWKLPEINGTNFGNRTL